MLLALDLSTVCTGFAFGGERDGAPRTGSWRLPGADESVFDRTLGSISESIAQLAKMIQPEHVMIEAFLMPTTGSHAHTIQALIQMTGAARAAAFRAGAKVHRVSSQTVRKHFLGVGRPDDPKAAVLGRCKLLGWAVEGHDAADAAATWSYGMAKLYPQWSPRSTPLFGRAG